MFSVHTMPEEFKNAAIVFEEKSVEKVCFFPHENERPAFSNSSGLKRVFGKLRFRDGFVWT